MMKKFIVLISLMSLFAFNGQAQNVGLKTNVLYDLTTTLSLSAEVALNSQKTLDILGAYNPWTFSDDKKMRFWLVQPELRHWFCETFEGHFVGVHLHGAQYFGGFRSKRYDGYLAGGGVSYGYDWILSPHWNLEWSIGLGYARLWYKESERIPCLKDVVDKHKNYWGVTRLGLSFTYIF